MRKQRKWEKQAKNWYYIITMGMGIFVCVAAAALFAYLARLVFRHGMDLTLGLFLCVPLLTFGAGLFFIYISGLQTEETPDAAAEGGKVMKQIGILSDTHGLLRPQVSEVLKDCDYIIHGGDFDTPEVLKQLNTLAPLYGVRGNNDIGAWAEELKPLLRFEICGFHFLLVHDKKDIPEEGESADIVVFGHSHKYSCKQEGDVLWLNPGGCGKRRFGLPLTFAVMEIEENRFRIKAHILEEMHENRAP